ncbi:hypothetical protein OAO87_01155 [bacterium]|nr:hypothetical protein [bacterium]
MTPGQKFVMKDGDWFVKEFKSFIDAGVHNLFDELDKLQNFEKMFEMLADENMSDFLLCHMENNTVLIGPYKIVEQDEFHELGYGSCILKEP